MVFINLLYANSIRSKSSSQSLRFLLLIHLNSWHKCIFTNFVWPSIWGWKIVKKWSLVPSFPYNIFTKKLKNFESRTYTVLWGSPCKWTTLLKKRLVIWLASSTLWRIHSLKPTDNKKIWVLSHCWPWSTKYKIHWNISPRQN